jgi:hypothetical protein
MGPHVPLRQCLQQSAANFPSQLLEGDSTMKRLAITLGMAIVMALPTWIGA